jgi:hypothetical protein
MACPLAGEAIVPAENRRPIPIKAKTKKRPKHETKTFLFISFSSFQVALGELPLLKSLSKWQ